MVFFGFCETFSWTNVMIIKLNVSLCKILPLFRHVNVQPVDNRLIRHFPDWLIRLLFWKSFSSGQLLMDWTKFLLSSSCWYFFKAKPGHSSEVCFFKWPICSSQHYTYSQTLINIKRMDYFVLMKIFRSHSLCW